jgi:hypothetical protein
MNPEPMPPELRPDPEVWMTTTAGETFCTALMTAELSEMWTSLTATLPLDDVEAGVDDVGLRRLVTATALSEPEIRPTTSATTTKGSHRGRRSAATAIGAGGRVGKGLGDGEEGASTGASGRVDGDSG